jgi:hypothetical protein
MVPIWDGSSQDPRALDVRWGAVDAVKCVEQRGVWTARARRYNDSVHHERNAMYIGIGTVVVILIILLLIGVLR